MKATPKVKRIGLRIDYAIVIRRVANTARGGPLSAGYDWKPD